MKRMLGIVFLVYAATAFMASRDASALSIVRSKHDLSSDNTATATIRSVLTSSGGTSEICVFCHTPHSAKNDAPLWNRALSAAPYTLYASDVLTALGYPAAEDPQSAVAPGSTVHVKTRICMSCHDGTIALGSLVNLPSPLKSAIPMLGAVDNKIPNTAAGYIGTDLSDDHPVAIEHNPSNDPELTLVANAKIKLYTAAGKNYIECTSCHNAHDNRYGKFLVDSNMQSALCTNCHNKADDDSTVAGESAHSNTTIVGFGYAPPNVGTAGEDTVQTIKCMACHFPHKAGTANGQTPNPTPGAGKYLLTFKDETTCFNNPNRWGQSTSVCHGTGASAKVIQGLVAKTSAHRVGDYSSVHKATEDRNGYGWLLVSGNSMHVECADCHNSHTAGRQLHTVGTNTVTRTTSLWGAGGAEPGARGAWTSPSSYQYIEPIGLISISGANLGVGNEYQICYRCHSSFAWGNGSIPKPTWSDQAKEFNTQNTSFHPVEGSVTRSIGAFNAPWNNGSLTMYCSDCHGNNSAGAVGPHGSDNSAIMVWPANGSTYGAQNGNSTGKQANTDLCLKCHDSNVYNDDTQPSPTSTATGFRTSSNLNLHNRHAYLAANSTIPNKRAHKCVNCHTRNAHGWKRKALVVFRGDGSTEPYPPPYTAAYEAEGANTGLIDNTSSLATSGNYAATKGTDCTTASAIGCHQ